VDAIVRQTLDGELLPCSLEKKVHRKVARAVSKMDIRQGIACADYFPYVED
jgi:hypothetical protein